ncbi:MAG: carbon-nitrogen family hydrolase [Polyangiaceae bacterium]|nr:carbon-nitrogen family hydrolase [Myxococcales bacterium]MCB9590182.1 carbon-nitrogen family hydrolase [Polyangiaceae bacterium]MCB9608061.1 carbon-nitrogen family hydrolase [Polyangiaceae bacterium]
MRVAAVQYDIAWEDPAQNFERLRKRIAEAAQAGASLVVLPEMFSCGFSMATERISEPFAGPSAQFVAREAQAHGVWLCGSFPELLPEDAESKHDARPANTLVLSSPDGELSRYQKIHPFTFAREHEHYRAGTEFLVREVCGVSCCFFVCYDLRFANEFWVNAPRTDCYVVVANWPEKRRSHWQALLLARAIENQAYVVGVNRVGKGGELDYAGDSAIIDPLGQTLCSAAISETTLYAELDAALVKKARERFPVLQDRRDP